MANQTPPIPEDGAKTPKPHGKDESGSAGGTTKPVDTGAQEEAAEERKKEGGYQ
jgi:hypothetical protein